MENIEIYWSNISFFFPTLIWNESNYNGLKKKKVWYEFDYRMLIMFYAHTKKKQKNKK